MTLKEEQAAFERQLTDLMKTHPGEYVLFKDGSSVEFHKDSDSAVRAGLRRFGANTVFLVAPIEEQRPGPVSVSWEAGVMFG